MNTLCKKELGACIETALKDYGDLYEIVTRSSDSGPWDTHIIARVSASGLAHFVTERVAAEIKQAKD